MAYALARARLALVVCLAACSSSSVLSLRAPRQSAALDGPSLRAEGSTGASTCTVASSQSMLGMRRQQSTCGTTRALAGVWNVERQEEAESEVQLRCYAVGTSALAKEGEQGECRIPRTKPCDPEQQGLCRAGTRCQSFTLHRRYGFRYTYHQCRE